MNTSRAFGFFAIATIFLSSCGVSKAKYEALNNQFQEQERSIAELELQLDQRASRLAELEDQRRNQARLVSSLEKEIQDGSVRVSRLKDKLTVDIVDRVLFPSGEARVSQEGREILAKVANVLRSTENKQFFVNGHTDNIPIGERLQRRFPTNWELSTARATSVVRYLIDQEVPAQNMVAAGYAEFSPRATNETIEGRSQNRRIEIVLVPDEMTIERSSDLVSDLENILSDRPRQAGR